MSSKKERISAEVALAINDRFDQFEFAARRAIDKITPLLKTQHSDWAERTLAYWQNVLSAIKWMRVRKYEIEIEANNEHGVKLRGIPIPNSTGGQQLYCEGT